MYALLTTVSRGLLIFSGSHSSWRHISLKHELKHGFELQNVKNEDLGEEADRLKKKSNALLEDAKNVQTSLNGRGKISETQLISVLVHPWYVITWGLPLDLKPQLKEAKKRLQDAKDKKEQLLKDLKDAQSMLNIDKGRRLTACQLFICIWRRLIILKPYGWVGIKNVIMVKINWSVFNMDWLICITDTCKWHH